MSKAPGSRSGREAAGTEDTDAGAERLQKVLAHAGVASRRAAEAMIREGRVKVNGRVVTELGTKVDAGRDSVSVDDEPIRTERPVHFAFNKPCHVLCTSSDSGGRPTVIDYFQNVAQRLYTVGRLDWDAEGLIFVTNDGAFAHRVSHPSSTVPKVYLVEVAGRVAKAAVGRMLKGVLQGGELLKAVGVKLLTASGKGSKLEVTLHGGRNRHIKRMLKALGHETTAIRRIAIGAVQLARLEPGKHRRLTRTEIESFGGRR